MASPSDINAYVDYILTTMRTADSVARTTIPAENWWQGDQLKLPAYPAGCVEPGPKLREFGGSQRSMHVNTDIVIMIYVGRVQDAELNQREAVTHAQAVENILHEHSTVNNLAIHSFVTNLDPGYATRAGVLLRACRLVFNIQTEEFLPQAAP